MNDQELIIDIMQIVAPVLGALGLTLVVQKLKRWLHVQNDQIKIMLHGLMGFIAGAAEYLFSSAASNPTILGQRTAVWTSLMFAVYHFPGVGVKALTGILKDSKAERERQERIHRNALQDNDLPVINPLLLDNDNPTVTNTPVTTTTAPVTPAAAQEFPA